MAFATCDKNNKPNVVAIGFQRIFNDKIWVFDTHFGKTKENILQNDKVSIVMWEGKEGYQIKGIGKYYIDCELFEKAVQWAKENGKRKPTKGLVEIEVKEIYSITPTYEEAGRRLA